MRGLRDNEKGFSVIEILLLFFVLAAVIIVGYFVLNRSNDNKNKANPNFAPIALGTFSYSSYEFPKLPSDFKFKDKSSISSGDTYVSYLNSKPLPQIEIELTNVCKGNNYQLGGVFNYSTVGSSPDYSNLCVDPKANTTDGWQFEITTNNKPNTWDVIVTENADVGCTETLSLNSTNICSSPACNTFTVYGDSSCIN